MASLNNLPSLALEKILGHLDNDSKENLYIASGNSNLRLEIEALGQKRTLLCPICVGMAGFENSAQFTFDPKVHELSRCDFIKFHREFNFTAHVEMESLGHQNYERVWESDGGSGYYLKNKYTDVSQYKRIRYIGESDNSSEWWGRNLIDVLKQIDNDEALKSKYTQRMHQLFLGGTYKGFKIESKLSLFTKEELLTHLRENHYSERVWNLRQKNPNLWFYKLPQIGETVHVPMDMYHDCGMIDDLELEELALDVTTARYLAAVADHKPFTSRQLMKRQDYIMSEVQQVCKVLQQSLSDFRFPLHPILTNDMNYYKKIDVLNLILSKIL